MMTAERPNPPKNHTPSLDIGALERDAGLILEALGQGVCVCTRGGEIVWGNDVFRKYADGIQKRVAVACRRVASQAHDSDLDDPIRWRRRQVRIRVPASHQFFSVVVAPVVAIDGSSSDPANEPSRFVALVSEVTDQESLRQKIASINRAGRDLLRFEQGTLERMHVSERLALLEERVISAAGEILSFDHFAIRLLNEESNQLELVMSTGLPPEARAIDLFAELEGQGISGYVATTGRSYICADTADDERYVFGLESGGSSLTVPLRLFDRTLGIFNIERESTDAFSESDRQLAEIFGHSIAMALHILNLLVVERYKTREDATGNVQGELAGPLNDLLAEAEALRGETDDPHITSHIANIIKDAESIRRRMDNVASGAQTLLGAEDALQREHIDPVLEDKRILVADNERVVRETIRDVLTKRGCKVTTCDDGDSATKLLLQWKLSHDADQAFDLVISDINLGDKTGYEVFSAAKDAKDDLPVILMTGFGYDPHHSIVRASHEGLQCVLFKPFQVETLVEEARGAIADPVDPSA